MDCTGKGFLNFVPPLSKANLNYFNRPHEIEMLSCKCLFSFRIFQKTVVSWIVAPNFLKTIIYFKFMVFDVYAFYFAEVKLKLCLCNKFILQVTMMTAMRFVSEINEFQETWKVCKSVHEAIRKEPSVTKIRAYCPNMNFWETVALSQFIRKCLRAWRI